MQYYYINVTKQREMKDFNDNDAPDGFMDDIQPSEGYYDDEFYEGTPLDDCPKCGRTYDHIGFDYQYCKKCGWDAENNKFIDTIEPTTEDYMCGDADILTGTWI